MPEPDPVQPQEETPPRAAARAAREASGRRQRPTVDDKLRESLTGTYEMLGAVLLTAGLAREDQGLIETGVALANRADDAASAWLDVAEKNPKVKAALRRFTEGSAFAGLVGVHVAMAAPVLASRGIIPPHLAAVLSRQPAPTPSPNGNGESSH